MFKKYNIGQYIFTVKFMHVCDSVMSKHSSVNVSRSNSCHHALTRLWRCVKIEQKKREGPL